MTKVFVLTYSHRHGTDVSVYTKRLYAEQAAALIMLEWFDDLDEKSPAANLVLRYISKKEYTSAMEVWCANMDEEFFTIEEQKLIAGPSATRDIVKALDNIQPRV